MSDTIISNTPVVQDDSAALSVFGLILLVAVVGGVILFQNGFFNSTPTEDTTTNINVTIPDPVAPAPTTN